MSRNRLAIVLAAVAGAALLLWTSATVRRTVGLPSEEKAASAAHSRRDARTETPTPKRESTEVPIGKFGQLHPNGFTSRRTPSSFPSAKEVLDSSRQERTTRTVALRWTAGDEWVVYTWFRQMHQPRGGWSKDPVRFRYRVKGLARFDGAECHEVAVDMPDAADFRSETFYVDAGGYTVRGLSRMSREKGEWVPRTYVGSARVTSVPFDLPGASASGPVNSGTDPFTIFRFSEPGAPRPAADQLVGAGGDYTEITIASSDGTIRQRWAAGDSKWPVESVSNEARSYRLK